MSKLVAIMSMSLDGYVDELNDAVGEVFDWYFSSGDVEFHAGGSDPMTFKVTDHRVLTTSLLAMVSPQHWPHPDAFRFEEALHG